jgi:hypothetical protein
MSVRYPASSSHDRPAPGADAACYRETVRLLTSLTKRHRSALAEFADRCATPRITSGASAAFADQLGERVGRLEDAAVGALARLARTSDYEDAMAAMQESGSIAWLWGTVLNRAVEATAAARVSPRG